MDSSNNQFISPNRAPFVHVPSRTFKESVLKDHNHLKDALIRIRSDIHVHETKLVEMLSKLWNVSLDAELERLKGRLLEFLKEKLKHGKFSWEADNVMDV